MTRRIAPLLLLTIGACTEDLQLSPDSASPGAIGSLCQRDTDCMSSMCYLGRNGGYCSGPCEVEGTSCARDSVCKPVQGGAKLCLVLCGAAWTCGREACPPESCPAGSTCVGASGGGVKVCEPAP